MTSFNTYTKETSQCRKLSAGEKTKEVKLIEKLVNVFHCNNEKYGRNFWLSFCLETGKLYTNNSNNEENTMFKKSMNIADYDPVLWQAIQDENRRQEEHIELIASENYASPRVMEAHG